MRFTWNNKFVLHDLYNSANAASSAISNWFKNNRLTINCNKSAYILFFPSKEDDAFIATNNLTLYIDNTAIGRVNCVKFLGVMIDEHMHFKQHVEFIKTLKVLTVYCIVVETIYL